MKIVAVIPAFNEASRVSTVVHAARQYVDRVVVVDDGSLDATSGVAAAAGAIVVRHPENTGAGAATMTGIEAARALGAGIIVTIDADEQHDPRDIPALLRPVREGCADIVFANRFGPNVAGKNRNRIPAIRRLFNTIGNVVTFLATGLWVRDSQCGFKVFGPKALKEVYLQTRGFEFCTEVIREARHHRWRIADVPVKVVYSAYTLAKGQSFAMGVKTAFQILLRSFRR
ncbi:glycosyltransferase family 2 protein [Candidatus Peregrinibacteria bacterium]|nr:glycosyltransferase family 2 protein [Candidatus Peregrinibacteria bacterium]